MTARRDETPEGDRSDHGSPARGGGAGTSESPTSSSSDLVRTRTSAAWVGLVLATLIVVAVLIFIVQNNHDVRIDWLGFHVRISLALALLIAAVAGVLVPILAGGARIVQLRVARRRAKREQPPS